MSVMLMSVATVPSVDAIWSSMPVMSFVPGVGLAAWPPRSSAKMAAALRSPA
jgi:hypothetical protein